MSLWKHWTEAEVGDLLDFSAGKRDSADPAQRRLWSEIDSSQRRGATALLNRFVRQDVVWLADEVGMGKTFVALGLLAILRRQKPDARVLILLPSSRLQPKWDKELLRFSRGIPRPDDAWSQTLAARWGQDQVVKVTTLPTLVQFARRCEGHEVLGTVSSFSFALQGTKGDWERHWREIRRGLGLTPRINWNRIKDKGEAKAQMVAAMRTLLRPFDLVIIDESHALKHGLKHMAARNQCMAGLLGPKGGDSLVGKLLFLSATPVETSYVSLRKQAEVLGKASAELKLLNDDDREASRRITRAHVIRRLQTLDVADGALPLTKNQYRREWRHGGMRSFDAPMRLDDAGVQRLVLAVVQRNVVESLVQHGDHAAKRFLPSFQSGMLSSFESFGETLSTRRRTRQARVATATAATEEEDKHPTHEGLNDLDLDDVERHGVDSQSIDQLSRSYRKAFRDPLPHPKMDEVAAAIAQDMARGEKSLVFVRRVRTVEELAAKVARHHDDQLMGYLRGELAEYPELLSDLEQNYTDEYLPQLAQQEGHAQDGASLSFFGHFFRGAVEKTDGKAKEGAEEAFKLRAAAWFRTKVLQARGRRWSTFFFDNHVADLLGGIGQARAWAQANRDRLMDHRRWYIGAKKQQRARRFELWQQIALDFMVQTRRHPQSVSRSRLKLIRNLVSEGSHHWRRKTCGRIGDPVAYLSQPTLFTALAERREASHPLGITLWPEPGSDDDVVWLRERILRREILASSLRLGRPVVDLWLTAAILTGNLQANPEERQGYADLLTALLARLDRQRLAAEAGDPTWTSYRELAALADHHDMLLDVVMPELAEVESASELRRSLGRKLADQSPVLGLHGGSRNPRGLSQFLLPGFPQTLVCTDILGEGQDMHTFCAKVLHYGAASTASSTEQRTGRVDRIRSLVHRRMTADRAAEDMLQVHYPHLIDTLEPVQFSRLYWRIDAFLHLMHDDLVMPKESGREFLRGGAMAAIRYRSPPTKRLQSSFEVDEEEDL